MSTVCNPGPTGVTGVDADDAAARRLDVLRVASGCVTYHEAPLVEDGEWTLRLYGNCRTGELFVQLTNGAESLVRRFMSSAPEMTAGERAEGIVWPDLVAAFALAREMHRAAAWGGPGA